MEVNSEKQRIKFVSLSLFRLNNFWDSLCMMAGVWPQIFTSGVRILTHNLPKDGSICYKYLYPCMYNEIKLEA